MTGILAIALLTGCNKGTSDVVEPELPASLLVLGDGSVESVSFSMKMSSEDGLNRPRDLAFNPDRPDELWTVNRRDDSVTIAHDTDGEMTTEHRIDPYALHFMEQVSSIAFGQPGTFATCQESRNTYNGQGQANDFMGPTLWSSDLDIFASSNPEAVDAQGFDLGSHLDMLHETPLCMGIDWAGVKNEYWVFDGHNSAISWIDFNKDHGVGWDDHRDGEIRRYVTDSVKREPGVPSHLAFDTQSELLYIADTGNGRIAVLDTTSGEAGRRLSSVEPYPEHIEMDNASIETLIEHPDFPMPSGLELFDGMLWVSDASTGRIGAFDLDGNLVADLDTGVGEGLSGIAFDSSDAIWGVSMDKNEVFRIAPK